ncbi:hypothetical protein D3C71_1479440 [compost metagenome]
MPQIGAGAAGEAEILQRHHGFFAELHQRQPEIQIRLPVAITGLVEHRTQAEAVGLLAEFPDQLTHHRRRPDRITHRHQRTAVALHHHEAIAVFAAQDGLVAGHRQTGLGVMCLCEYRAQLFQRFACRCRQRAAGAVQQTRKPEHDHHQADQQQRTQGARCIAGGGELPPQLVLVLDVAVDEEQQPHRRHQHQRDVAQPRP